ncbi:MAG TPA: TlpA disulfide reductase family protein [Chloroflexota bacterium]|nr:TlpA disulfide reductase family protein [Chloroflexota bacterium]
MRRSLWSLVVAAPLVALLALGFRHDPNAPYLPLLGRPAPAFTLQTLDGRSVSLSTFRGRPVVINFWASWCTSCRVEHRYLAQSWRDFSPRGVTFLGIAYDDSVGAARAFLKAHGGGWVSLEDPGGQTAVDYGVSGVPETVFIDRRGIVRFRSPGPVAPGGAMSPAEMARDIATLLRSRA